MPCPPPVPSDSLTLTLAPTKEGEKEDPIKLLLRFSLQDLRCLYFRLDFPTIFKKYAQTNDWVPWECLLMISELIDL